MSDWLKAPVRWDPTYKSILFAEDDTIPTPDVTLEELIKKSSKFPIGFPINSIRCDQLQQKTSKKSLEKNINSTYPIIHEYGLYLCAIFLHHQRTFGFKKDFYRSTSLLQLVDRLLNKRAVMFLEARDVYMLINGQKGSGNWESIGTEEEKNPLILENCLSYDEIKLSALLSVSSHSFFINDGNRYNQGVFERDREKVEENGVIVGLIGTRFEKPDVMEYQEVVITKDQNNQKNGFGDEQSLQTQFLKFYGRDSCTYEEMEEEMKNNKERYVEFDKGKYFDKVLYEKRLALSIDTFLIEANHRAKLESTMAYIHVVGIGLGVWKLCGEQNKIFMSTFAERLELLSDLLTHVSDVRFAYIRETSAGKYKNGDCINKIRIHIENKNPQEKLKGDDDCKLLVVSYPWDGNALPGNEFWGGSLSGSGDPAAAASTQVAELHNGHINEKVKGRNLMVATSKGVVTFLEYQNLHKND